MVFPPNVETDLDNYFFNYLDGLGMLLTVVHCYRIVVIEFLVANMTVVAIHSLEVRSDIALPLGFVLAVVVHLPQASHTGPLPLPRGACLWGGRRGGDPCHVLTMNPPPGWGDLQIERHINITLAQGVHSGS